MKIIFSIFLFIVCSSLTNAQPMMNTDSIKNKWKDIPYATVSAAQKLFKELTT